MTDFSPVWAIITSGVSWIRSALWKEYSDRKNASIYQAGRRFIDRFTETDADALDAAKSTYYNQNSLPLTKTSSAFSLIECWSSTSVGTSSLTSHLSLVDSFLCVVFYKNRKISVKLYQTSVRWNCCEISLWEVCLWPTTYPRGGGGTHRNSWCGCAARFSKSWPYFRQKNVIFHTRSQTRPLKSILVSRLRF